MECTNNKTEAKYPSSQKEHYIIPIVYMWNVCLYMDATYPTSKLTKKTSCPILWTRKAFRGGFETNIKKMIVMMMPRFFSSPLFYFTLSLSSCVSFFSSFLLLHCILFFICLTDADWVSRQHCTTKLKNRSLRNLFLNHTSSSFFYATKLSLRTP